MYREKRQKKLRNYYRGLVCLMLFYHMVGWTSASYLYTIPSPFLLALLTVTVCP